MPSLQIFFSLLLFFLFLLFLLFPQRARGDSSDCSTSSCPAGGPPVRFPFRLRRIQKRSCGYPKFVLSCSNQTNLTTLTLPGSGAFLVKLINYRSQKMWIDDPNNCLPKRFLAHPFSLHDTPFSVLGDSKNYTFLNCSSSQTTSTFPAKSISCLSSLEYTVYAVPTSAYHASAPAAAPSSSSSSSSSPELCSVISTALVPRGVAYEWSYGRVSGGGGVAVTWSQPDCSACEAGNETCGLDTDTRQIVCTDRKKSPGRLISDYLITPFYLPFFLSALFYIPC